MFQVASDIHLELWGETSETKLLKRIEKIIEPSAPNLLLAGDIGHAHRPNYIYFLQWCSSKFKRVFLISGNHEYYSTKKKQLNIEQTDALTKKVCTAFENVHFLQKERFEFTEDGINYIILGCTFWAPIPPHYEHEAAIYMNDFRNIYYKEFLLKPHESNELHTEHKKWLFNELDDSLSSSSSQGKREREEGGKERIIVMTHHVPSLKFNVGKGSLPFGYAGDYEHLIGNYIDAWVCGHTHENHRFKTKDGTLLLSNCIGYNGQNTNFSPTCSFSLL